MTSILKVIFYGIIMLCFDNTYAQNPDSQDMKEAKRMMDSIKKANPQLYHQMGFDKMEESMTKNAEYMDKYNKPQDNTSFLPQNNPASNVKNILKPNEAMIISMAKSRLQFSQPKLDIIFKARLDKMAADTSINVAGTGVMLLGVGIPKFAGDYLICKDLIKNPKIAWTVNDMGALFRDEKKYEKALQCFLYADALNNKSIVIKTNIGSTAAYYGDFSTAKKYYNDALAMNEYYGPALEGLATVLYQEGDIKALFQCLLKEVTSLGGGGSGPSSEFASLCGGIQQEKSAQDPDVDHDPTSDHTYDNDNGDQGNQDPPPGADDKPVKYPDLKPIFVKDGNEIWNFITQHSAEYTDKLKTEFQNNNLKLKASEQNLKPLKQPSYKDEHGDIIVPSNYEKFYDLYLQTYILYDRKIHWYMKKYAEEIEPFLLSVNMKDLDMIQAYGAAMSACNQDPNCENRVKCEWRPKFQTTKNGDLVAGGLIWNKYFDKMHEAMNWFISASSPFIQRVHDPGWNNTMNVSREKYIRDATLDMYGRWLAAIVQIGSSGISRILSEEISCQVELRSVGESTADPFSKKLKKLKTFAEPCHKEGDELPFVIGKIIDNCDQTIIQFGNDEANVSFGKYYSKKYVEDDYFKTSLTVGISKSIGSEIGGFEGKVEVNAGVTFSTNYDQSGNITERTIEGKLSATIGGSGNAGRNSVDEGVSAHVNVSTLVGPNQTSAYTISNVGVEKK